ncbi:MAG: CHASE2 domain-containing protein [Bacteroidetes bacterium]|nr:CHASE2 domain-containing protein [Bacteroidota bacterium]
MFRVLIKSDTFFATLFIFLVIGLLDLILVNTSFLDPFERAFADFHYTDILYSKILKDHSTINTNIILVNIDTLNRSEIAKELGILQKYNPKVIGLDVQFTSKKDPKEDSILKDRLGKIPNLVTTTAIEEGEGEEFSEPVTNDPYFGVHMCGHVNFTGNDPKRSTVRTFYPFIKVKDREIPSFSAMIVKLFDSLKYVKLQSRNRGEEIINYSGNYSSFRCLSSSQVLADDPLLTEIKDRIVLVGYFNTGSDDLSVEDKYFTPLNSKVSGRSLPDMYGLVIHANVISMILNQDYIDRVPGWLNILIAFLIIYWITAFFIYLYVDKHFLFHPVGKLTVFCCLVLLLYLVLALYHYFNIFYSSTLLLVVLVLTPDLMYFYEGIRKALYKWFGLKSYFISGNKSH